MSNHSPSAAIYGVAGYTLDAEERDFFREANPLGFILFGRNVQTPEQVRALVADLRAAVGRADAPVLIDQEGGRVQRLRPPHWRSAPPAGRFGLLYRKSAEQAMEAARLNGRLIADDLLDLGITVVCAPVVDLTVRGAHDVIGDRAFDADPAVVARLAGAFMDGLRAGGVMPIIKHIPGHGRARSDSHLECPVVDESVEELTGSDFDPFRRLAVEGSDRAWAMTAHIVYRAVDTVPATISRRVIEEVIRRAIGFDGVLLSDDLSMQALAGDLGERARASLAAGCDLVLHCNGRMDEMRAVAAATGPLTPAAAARIARAAAALPHPASVDRHEALARLDTLIATAA